MIKLKNQKNEEVENKYDKANKNINVAKGIGGVVVVSLFSVAVKRVAPIARKIIFRA